MAITRQQFAQWAIGAGWQQDKQYPHIFRKETNIGRLRWVCRKLVARKEVQHTDGRWLRIKSAYYKDLEVTPEGVLRSTVKTMF